MAMSDKSRKLDDESRERREKREERGDTNKNTTQHTTHTEREKEKKKKRYIQKTDNKPCNNRTFRNFLRP